ncbi:MAG: thiamine biosynthesis protein ApbE [Sphingomonadales bacterium 32-68-7]|nr:MAG: thiamine biosynthesis protein ApbE [Sphingomonadales bacterium 12-68-11]OYX09621.1 MAG: thiamine biosynthesis protein ApbE [Sphingomonadales bacterium 32-68-7]
MGTAWSVQAVDPPADLRLAVEAVLSRIVAQMSQWEPESALTRFNRAAPGVWQALPVELSRVLAAGLKVAEASSGAFDPAMGALADLWGFGPPGPQPVPAAPAIAQARVGYVEHQAGLLRARRFGVAALDFSGIAKGYAVDAVAARLRAMGVADFLMEIGGEFVGAGIRPDGQPWWIDVEPVPGAALEPLRVALHGLAIATSGDYRRHFSAHGQRYAHTLDPRTGAPLDNGVASVAVLQTECMLADAWATALTVSGPEVGLATAVREGLAMHMVVREGAGFREVLSPALAAMLG